MTVIDFNQTSTFFPAYKSHWGVEGYVFSAQTRDYDHDREADDIEGSGWGARFENNLPSMQKASDKIKGLHAGGPGQVGHILMPMVGATTPKRIWKATETLNVLAPATFGPASLKKYSVSAKMKDAVEFDAEWGYRGDVDDGNILVTPKTANVLVTTGNGSDLDNTLHGGATSFGANAQLHVYDLAGGTTPTVAVVIQHSDDGTTWTTLGSFATVSEATSSTSFVQRIAIPSTTVVNAHVRAQWTTTGTPTSVQALVLFARNVDPDA